MCGLFEYVRACVSYVSTWAVCMCALCECMCVCALVMFLRALCVCVCVSYVSTCVV